MLDPYRTVEIEIAKMNAPRPGKRKRLLDLLVKHIANTFRYLFVRRYAIKPERFRGYGNSCDPEESKLIFRWQRMPKGYRWF